MALETEREWREAAYDLLSDPPPGGRAGLRNAWLIPAARRLGEAWSDDTASFADVTIGMGRLQWLLDGAPDAPRDGAGPRVLLAPTPGDGHVFGLALLAEELREGGFSVELHTQPTVGGVARAVALRPVAVLGIGVSVTRHAGRAAALVRAGRRGAREGGRPMPLIVAGGPATQASEALLRSAGVDAILDASEPPSDWLARRLGAERESQGLELSVAMN